MPLADVYGQEDVKKIIRQDLLSGRLPHSLLFTGSDEPGMIKMAMILAQALNCLQMRADACGECSSCRAIARGRFPDVLQLSFDEEEGKKRAGIDEIREIRQLALMRPMIGRSRVFLIERAERMSLEAANALLKILEEPPEVTYFILITTNLDLIPATVPSRCRLISFKPISPETIEKRLISSGVEPGRAKLAAVLAEGSLERALALDWEKMKAERHLAWQYFCLLTRSKNASFFLQNLTSIKTENLKQELEKLMRLFLIFYRDLLLLQEGGDENLLLNPDLAAQMKELGLSLKPDFCLQGMEIVQEILSGLQRNLNSRLLATYFYVQMRRISHG